MVFMHATSGTANRTRVPSPGEESITAAPPDQFHAFAQTCQARDPARTQRCSDTSSNVEADAVVSMSIARPLRAEVEFDEGVLGLGVAVRYC